MAGPIQIIILDANEQKLHGAEHKFSPHFMKLIGNVSHQDTHSVKPTISVYDAVRGEYPTTLTGVGVIVITGSCK